ncbi:sulfite exporter TauE/SafE family protein [Lipingzhangella sp. LS1_29]|uniref:Probable membrane transporter protein n=1 Tax=Lipingzhangella rawalii TaxID=2055835 RepID=A0ABU2H0K8_9ACTN|nr:sulfite exporter TauE/SafE family protein [Lipingzhangella rawalii]MDS1268840.1 sulfite exporter TauE/SafE family protein [Lipingzhangella rawalii]
MTDVSILLLAGTAVLAGSVVQSGVGIGLGLVAAPVVALLDPTLMPGAMLIAAIVLPVLTVRAEGPASHTVDWRGIGWSMPARILGTVAGVWIVALVTPKHLALGVGVMVLVAVAVTASAVRVRTTPLTLSLAGLASGMAGTATSMGGPPMALAYQNESGPRVRATLGMYFLIGVALSLIALVIGNQLPARQVAFGLALAPFVLVGFVLAGPVRRHVDGGMLRRCLLTVVTVSGIVLVGQGVW